MDLTNHQWALIRPLLPPPSGSVRGRPSYPARLILDAILWKIRAGLPWYNLPAIFPAWQTCYNHYRKLRDAGVLDQIYVALYRDLAPHLIFDLEDAYTLGLLQPIRREGRYHLRVNYQEDGTWQSATLCLLLHVLAEKTKVIMSRNLS